MDFENAEKRVFSIYMYLLAKIGADTAENEITFF